MVKVSELRIQCAVAAVLIGAAGGGFAAGTGTSAVSDELQEIVVTGTRLGANGFTTPTPVTVISQEVLQQRAPTDANDILKEIPQLRISNGPTATGPIQTSSAGQQYVNFYGLSSLRTLTLIDGHRQTGSAITGQVDVLSIPTFLIDRVELVTGGASAAYGSDALAGVANFVLKDRLDGFYGAASYGQAQHNRDRQVSTVDMGFGSDLFGGRGHFLVGAELSRDSGIDSWYDRDFGREEPGPFATGAAVVGGGGTRAGKPAILWANGYELAANTPGSIITGCTPAASCGSVIGTAFTAAGTAYAFPFGTKTGNFMYGTTANYGDNPRSFLTLSAPYKRWTGLTKFSYDITDDVQLKVNGGYEGLSASELGNIAQTTVTVPASNPFIPAAIKSAIGPTGTVTIGRTNTDIGANVNSQIDRAVNGVVDLSGKLAGSWKWDAYYSASQAIQWGDLKSPRTSDLIASMTATSATQCGTLTAAQIAASGPVSPGCVPFNPFGVGQASTAAYAWFNQYTQRFKVDSAQRMAEASVTGEAFDDWAGPVSVALGVDYRRDEADRIAMGDSLLYPNGGGFNAGNFISFSSSRQVREAYGEGQMPLLRGLPFAKALDLNVGYRYLDYSDQGSYNSWKAGATWEINDEYRFRATRSRDIRAPTLLQQYGIGTISSQSVLYKGATNTISFQNPAPSPGVKAEVSNTTVAGFVMQPHWVPGLRFSVDYFAFHISNVIASLIGQQLVDGCAAGVTAYCSQITFNSTGTAITAISAGALNLNQLYVTGFDIEADYRLPVSVFGGDLSLLVRGTNIEHYRVTDTVAKTVVEQSGYQLAAPRWNSNFMATWKHGAFSTSAEALYFTNIKYSVTQFGPEDTRYWQTVTSPNCPGGTTAVPTQCANYLVDPNSISRNIFPSAVYVNWSMQYDFNAPHLKQLQAYFKIDNLLDKAPPAFAADAFNGQSYYDLIGRNFKAGVRVAF